MKTLKFLVLAAAGLIFMNACQSQKKSSDASFTLANAKDSASYAIGVQIANNFEQNSILGDINLDAILAGMKDNQAGNPKITVENTDKIVNDYFSKITASKSGDKIKQGEEFLAAKEKEPGVVKTQSGLLYKEIKAGAGPSPKTTDKVKTHYRGTLINGTEFDSSYKRGEPAVFPVNAVIKGWTEALQLMKPGSKWELYIPYYLAYGERGAGQLIGPYETLIFEIELISIE
ncbi:MAG TPA: FKBP-type peptidyl-prolyl cis-trans isomerase [Bacteroidales bacterium]|nr:FKBP-type peptidyl-prolyl cis-trans isomerase [Bacteroidales bacterium]